MKHWSLAQSQGHWADRGRHTGISRRREGPSCECQSCRAVFVRSKKTLEMPEGNPISSVQENSNTSRKAQSTVVDSTLIASVSETSQRRNESGLPRRQPDPPPVGASAKRHPLSMLFCCLSSGVDNTDGHELSVSRQKSGASSNPTAVSSTGRKLVNPSANLLKPIAPEEVGKKCLVLDLDGMLLSDHLTLLSQKPWCIVPLSLLPKQTL